MNRVFVSSLARWNFAPTQAAENLRSEGVSEDSIFVTGNTVIDALLYAVKRDPVAEQQ